MKVRRTRFCWHCSRKCWGGGGLHRTKGELSFATKFINGALRMLHLNCMREIEADPFSFGYDYETRRSHNEED